MSTARCGAAGHDATRMSLFICEGLLVYLDLPVVERLFASLRSRVAGGATLAVSVSRRDRVVADPGSALRRVLLRRRLAWLNEPWRTSLNASSGARSSRRPAGTRWRRSTRTTSTPMRRPGAHC